ncbi:MAG: Rne/Rng family ribonuclease, partial [Microbacterium gubbeenense]
MAEEKNDTSTPTQDVRPDESDEQAREQEAATAAAEQAGKTQDDSGEPEIPTAVGLGLIEKDFVSRVSTVLNFYAPDPRLFPPVTSFDDHFRDDRYRDNDNDFDDRRSDGNRSSRRRRRRGGPASEEREHDEPREQRSRGRVAEVITEPQSIKGSTRLEAKKQRRRDGRDAGRRRTVVTEAEFLARRESVDRQMIVRSKQNRTQIGVLEDGVLVEHYVARAQEASLIGNIYLGRVQNVLPSMEAAFVDIGRGRNAVLYSGEVDWDAVETGNQPRRIELALKPGDKVLVQVSKDPVGHKGARLTSQISLPGRYLVYVPGGSMNGIS